MNENKINLVVPKDYNGRPIEVVLREGKAPAVLDPREPEKVVFEGTIDAPLRWLEKRVELINQKSSNITVSRNNMSLLLTIDETNYYRTQINGVLCFSKEMLEFGVNTGKEWEPIKLSQFFKMHRAFFKDKAENMTLVSTLKNFKAKVNQDIERSKEENGSKVDNYSQVVDSNLPKSFKLNIPLFKGFACEEIEVEIYADVDGRDVSLSLRTATTCHAGICPRALMRTTAAPNVWRATFTTKAMPKCSGAALSPKLEKRGLTWWNTGRRTKAVNTQSSSTRNLLRNIPKKSAN